MQTVHFQNEDCRLFCPVTGIPFKVETGSIDSPALVFLVVDEACEFSNLREDFAEGWNQIETSDEFDDMTWGEAMEKFSEAMPDNIVCFNMSDGISGGYVRIAFDMDYEPADQ